MSPSVHKRWLRTTAVIIGSFGPVFFLGAMIPTQTPARLTLDLLGWRLDHPSAYDAPDTRFLSALTGWFLLGWGVTVWCLSTWAYDAAPEGVRRSVLAGLLRQPAGAGLLGAPVRRGRGRAGPHGVDVSRPKGEAGRGGREGESKIEGRGEE